MIEISGDMNQIRRRFVRGVLKGLEAKQLHAFVTNAVTGAQDTPKDKS